MEMKTGKKGVGAYSMGLYKEHKAMGKMRLARGGRGKS